MSSSTRRRFLTQAAVTSGLLAPACSRGATKRPNILWLIVEDCAPDFGCYGTPLVHSPNLDGLARDGVRFDNAFVAGPVCSASRSGIINGMYQTSIGAHNHRSHRGDNYALPAHIKPFTHYLREAGYHTSNMINPVPGVRGGKTDFNFKPSVKVFDGTDWKQRSAGQPFYAQVNFHETHRIFERFEERPVDPAKVQLPPYYPDHPAMREDWAMYLDSWQHLDVKAGKVMDRLRQEGLYDDTIIILLGDNGVAMPRGKQFLYEDGIRIPLIVRIPEKYRPAGFQPGTVNKDLVSAIDITATTLMLAGVKPPDHMEGQVFFGEGVKKRTHIVAARDRCDETVDRIRCVRTQRYKYIRNYYPERAYTQPNVYKDTQYPPLRLMRQLKEEGKLSGPPALFMADKRPAEELYDLQSDPHEIRNLAARPEHKATLEDLRSTLDDWIKRTGDKGETPEPDIPDAEKTRTQLEGWCTRDSSRISRADGALRLTCAGKRNSLLRSYVVPGGDMAIQFRARTKEFSTGAFNWGAITDFANPANKASVTLNNDGNWHEYTIPFRVEGHLCIMSFDWPAGDGVIDFDWIRVTRKEAGGTRKLVEWAFA